MEMPYQVTSYMISHTYLRDYFFSADIIMKCLAYTYSQFIPTNFSFNLKNFCSHYFPNLVIYHFKNTCPHIKNIQEMEKP